MNKKLFLAIPAALALLAGAAGCTDTQRAHLGAWGSEGRVTCYSGTRLILDDFSTGKISNAAEGADGYEYNSETTHRLMQASGNCVVDYGATKQAGWMPTLPGVTEPAAIGVADTGKSFA